MNKTFTLKGEEFTGQDIDGVEVGHLGIDDKGLPIRQATLRFEGGFATAQQGDYIVTYPSGYRAVVPADVWEHKAKEEPKPAPKVAAKPAPKPVPVVSTPAPSTPFNDPFRRR